jgi:hypothetical protein
MENVLYSIAPGFFFLMDEHVEGASAGTCSVWGLSLPRTCSLVR